MTPYYDSSYWRIPNFWRHRSDFNDYFLHPWVRFETVETLPDLMTVSQSTLSMYQLPGTFFSMLAQGIYDYGFGKLCNLKDTARWKKNFESEIRLYLLENGRYLQALFRDVNKNIEDAGTHTDTTKGQVIGGETGSTRSGGGADTQTADKGSNQQDHVSRDLGDTLTVLNNQTTSTMHLASSNEDAYSKGSESADSGQTEDKGATHNIQLSQNNTEKLHDTKNLSQTFSEGTVGPLDIALKESGFHFQKWLDDLLERLDMYFTPGGYDYA